MDKICKKSEAEDFNKTLINTEETEFLKNRASPVFKCSTHTKTIKGSRLNSSDYDIPSYQVNQSFKSRTSSKYDNETSESILPFTPIFSPIPVASSSQFQPPSIHSLGTVAKNVDRSGQNKTSISSNCGKIQSVKPCGIYEGLGMTDKDISWVSSMATPPPKNVHGSEFNTIEKATFFPEEKFQSIQPRALFSPTLDTDFGCHPIIFTSESDDDDDDDDEEYKSNIRLSDVCATLKQLEVKSLDLVFDNSVEKVIPEKDGIISPVIRTKKRKLGSVKKKKKGSLVISPENKDKYEFSVNENLKTLECEKVKSNSVSNSIEDDSFQSMSFSGIDELCKTLVKEQFSSSMVSEPGDCNKTLVNPKENNNQKKFYPTKVANDIYTVSSMDNLHSYAKALEQGDKCSPKGCKIDLPLPEMGIVRFDALTKDIPKADVMKRLYSEVGEENDHCREKKLKKVSEDNSGWENVKQYLSESQLNISDGEIFRTVENLEKTLVSQENNLEKLSGEESQGQHTEEKRMALECASDIPENMEMKSNNTKDSTGSLSSGLFKTFMTDSGTKISVSEKALNKGKEILRDSDENLKLDKNKLPTLPDISFKQISKPEQYKCSSKEFPTGSGHNISAEALKNAKSFVSECKASDAVLQKIEGNLTWGFLTGSGKQIQISNNALEKANTLFSEFNYDEEKQYGEQVAMEAFSIRSGKKIQVSAKALEKSKALMAVCDKNEDHGLKNSTLNSKKLISTETTDFGKSPNEEVGRPTTKSVTSFGTKIQVSVKDLEEPKALLEECDERPVENLTVFKGFSTGSGKTIQVSAKALEKAKVLIAECDKNEDHGLKNSILNSKKLISTGSTDFGRSTNEEVGRPTTKSVTSFDAKIQVPVEALEKPKALLEDCDERSVENLTIFKGFSTGSGKAVQISAEAVEKTKLMNSDELATHWSGELKNQSVYTAGDSEVKAFPDKKEMDYPNICFSTALGSKVKVSNKALEKVKELWATSTENPTEVPGSSSKAVTHIEPPLMGFMTAGGSNVTISEIALAKAKKRMNDRDQPNPENSVNIDSVTEGTKTLTRKVSEVTETSGKMSGENFGKMSATSVTNESDDCNEIIPNWLHVYNTSPSIATERIELFPVVCDEDGKSSSPKKEYIVKSPILGSRDRFHAKIKKRKLHFGDEKESLEKIQSEFVNKNPDSRTRAKRTSNLALDFSTPFKKIKFVEDVTIVGLNVKSERARARVEQENVIKKKQKVKPLKGSHLSRKCSEKQMSWREAVTRYSPQIHSEKFLKSFGVREDVLQINIENAVSYRFKGEDFFGSNCTKNIEGFLVGDGCLLILDDDNKFGVDEVKRAFLASPGVQPNLVPQGWVENHFKWIIWKLAHYERCFPQFFGGNCLTANNIMSQLKYRYDREIDRNERSALKKILERDDTSIKRLVLCICGIQKIAVGEVMGYKLELTDGWYSCPAHSDPAMTRLIDKGKLYIGTKLVTQGAILVNCDQGVSPLEKNGDVYLKISTNSTRRIRWDAKLGFQKNPENFPVSLGSILPQGGPISRIDVIIVRTYPILYMEKTPDGHHGNGVQLTRNRKSEEKADSEYKRIQEERMEAIFNEVQSEFSKSTYMDKNLNRNNLNSMEQGEDLRQIVENSMDPSDFQKLIAEDQRKLLEKLHSNENVLFSKELREKIEKRLEKERLNKRNVSEFLRAKIVDFRKPDFNNPAILTVWNPNEDLTILLSEGRVVSLLNVTISNSSRIYKPLQINTTRQTIYRQMDRNVRYPARKLTKLRDVSSKVCPAFEEVDLVGIVILIRDVSQGSRLSQIVYLTDLEMNFAGIVFWGSCKDYGWENVLRIPSVVACSNLQWKKNFSHHDVPSLYVNDNSVFTENPKFVYLKEEIERLKQNMPQDKTSFLSKCEEDLTIKLEDSKWRANTSKNSSCNDSNLKEATTSRVVNGFETKPTASSTPIKPFSLSMGSGEPEPSPIQKRVEKLQAYPEPPSLIPLLTRNNLRRMLKKKS